MIEVIDNGSGIDPANFHLLSMFISLMVTMELTLLQ